ncbi:MAG: PEP-CTERM sorting domain-containing protein [Candidatus Scalindua sp.]|nr:PEP-CTERM sorting domain-containing protein [Candidatus Scalindua sp.]
MLVILFLSIDIKGEKMNKQLLVAFITGLFLFGMAGMVNAATLFSENFETGLSQWQGKSGGAHHGNTLADPLGGGSTVLNFTALNATGDIFSSSTSFSSNSGQYTLTFDYLGLDWSSLGTPGNLGGTIGYSYGLPGSHVWLAGTTLGSQIQQDILIDDGAWHTYSLSFTASQSSGIFLMLEDFSGSGGIAGDAYFDNIVLTDAIVPEPATIALLGIGLVGLAGTEVRRRRKKKTVDNS